MPRQSGFTLVELLVTLAVLGLLLGVAVPAFTGFLEAARASEAKSALVSSFVASVTRAVQTGRRTVLCPSTDGDSCGGGPDWSGGWIGFVDRDGNRERDADETLVIRQGKLGGQVRLRSTVGRTRIVFQGHGGNGGSNVTFTLCDGRGPAKAETLVISNGGRLRSGKPKAAAIAATCPT